MCVCAPNNQQGEENTGGAGRRQHNTGHIIQVACNCSALHHSPPPLIAKHGSFSSQKRYKGSHQWLYCLSNKKKKSLKRSHLATCCAHRFSWAGPAAATTQARSHVARPQTCTPTAHQPTACTRPHNLHALLADCSQNALGCLALMSCAIPPASQSTTNYQITRKAKPCVCQVP